MKAVQIVINPTGKSYSPNSEWQHLSSRPEIVTVDDMPAAMAYIRERYGKAKRYPMYCDTKDGTTKRVGYVIGFRNADWSHSPVDHWLQQDWISFQEVNEVELD